jgi:hypothetical protein
VGDAAAGGVRSHAVDPCSAESGDSPRPLTSQF